MKKENLLTVAVVALLLLNFGTLFFLLSRRPPHDAPPGGGRIDRAVVEKLHFDADKQEKFNGMKRAHHEQIEARDRAYREALHNYFALLQSDSVPAPRQDSMLAVLSGIQADKARLTFRHFQELKALAAPEYRNQFGELLPDLMQVMLPPQKRKSPENN